MAAKDSPEIRAQTSVSASSREVVNVNWLSGADSCSLWLKPLLPAPEVRPA